MQQFVGGERRPNGEHQGAELRELAQASAGGRQGVLLVTHAGHQHRDEFALDGTAQFVVSLVAPARLAHHARHVVGSQSQHAAAEGQLEVGRHRALTLLDGSLQHFHHAQVALHTARERRVDGAESNAANQVGEHHFAHTRLAQRRQHALDIAQEHAVRPDDQHALLGERKPVRIEKVCRAVQRDHRLAGTGAALHDEHALVRGANDDVLFRLDGGDDVAELPAAALAQRRQQHALAAQLRLVEAVVFADAEVVLAEEFVFDRHQGATLHEKVPASHELHGVAAGCAVEGLGDRCPPVDDELVVVFVRHGQTTDVERLGIAAAVGGAVDAPEHQGGVADVEFVEHLHQLLVEVVALIALLEGAAGLAGSQLADRQRLLAGRRQALVGPVDVRLFGGEIGVFGHFWGL